MPIQFNYWLYCIQIDGNTKVDKGFYLKRTKNQNVFIIIPAAESAKYTIAYILTINFASTKYLISAFFYILRASSGRIL